MAWFWRFCLGVLLGDGEYGELLNLYGPMVVMVDGRVL